MRAGARAQSRNNASWNAQGVGRAGCDWRGRSRAMRHYTRQRMGHGEHDDEPLDEGSPEEHAPRGALPDPLDRLWRHPTELPPLAAGFVPAPPAGGAPRRRSRAWMLPIVGGATGALVTVAALAVAGVLDRGASTA